MFGLGIDRRLKSHLKSLGVDPIWAPAARMAINCCDVGLHTTPVLTGAGPVAARDVIVTLKLEPFLRPGVYLPVGGLPGLLGGPIAESHRERFEDAATGWSELFANRASAESSEVAAAIGEIATIGGNLAARDDQSSRMLYRQLVHAGYIWRVAESHTAWWRERLQPPKGVSKEMVQHTPYGRRIAYYKAVKGLVEDIRSQAEPSRVLPVTVLTMMERDFPLAHASPGGSATGADFLLDAFHHVEVTLESEPVALNKSYRLVAFRCGLATYDAEATMLDIPE